MALTAEQIINDVASDLQDAGNVHWSRTDLLLWLNDGQREVVLFRPDASTSVVDLTLVAGYLQPIPATAIRLMRVIANFSGRACKNAQISSLDDQRPDWRNDTPSDTIKAWCYDERDPKRFEVWPPATTAAKLKLLLAVPPTDCANEGANIALDDQYKGPLMSYVRHRCYLRDSEDASSSQMSAEAYALFQQQLGIRTQTELSVKPEQTAPKRPPQ
jgi:hypothetical protein